MSLAARSKLDWLNQSSSIKPTEVACSTNVYTTLSELDPAAAGPDGTNRAQRLALVICHLRQPPIARSAEFDAANENQIGLRCSLLYVNHV